MSDGFWVFVGGMKSEADTDRMLVNLEHNGIKDALVMPATATEGRRVSLGLFSERARAERRADTVKSLGIKAEVAERKLPGTLYWVDLAPLPGINTIPLQDLFAQGVQLQDRRAARSCGHSVADPGRQPPHLPPRLLRVRSCRRRARRRSRLKRQRRKARGVCPYAPREICAVASSQRIGKSPIREPGSFFSRKRVAEGLEIRIPT